jgi:hypothetical protein
MTKPLMAAAFAAALMSTAAMANEPMATRTTTISTYSSAPTMNAPTFNPNAQYNRTATTTTYGSQPQYNAGQYGTGYTADQYNAMQYNNAAPAAGNPNYNAQNRMIMQERTEERTQRMALDRGYEAERPDNIEYGMRNRVQPYYRDMSMNDYNRRLKTAFRNQTRLQPEKGLMED